MAAPLIAALPPLWKLLAGFAAWETLPYLKGLLPMTPEQKRKHEHGGAELKLQERMFEAMQKGAKLTTKRSQARSDAMMKQLVGMRKEETGESRYRYLTDLMAGKEAQQNQMMMGLIGALMQNKQEMRPQAPSGMPLSMVELLRR